MAESTNGEFATDGVIGVRLAFGTGPSAVGLMVVGEGARLVVVGLVAGVGASLVLVRLVPALLYDTSHYDVMTFVAAPTRYRGGGAVGVWRARVARRQCRASAFRKMSTKSDQPHSDFIPSGPGAA